MEEDALFWNMLEGGPNCLHVDWWQPKMSVCGLATQGALITSPWGLSDDWSVSGCCVSHVSQQQGEKTFY